MTTIRVEDSPPSSVVMESGGPLERTVRRSKRLLIALFVAALLAVCAVLGVYAYRFHGPVSTVPGDWGPFGDYVGGILNPIFGFCTLSAVLATVYLQARSLESAALTLESTKQELLLAKQNAIDEAKRREQETLKQDLHEMFKALHGELLALFTRGVSFGTGPDMGFYFSSSAPFTGMIEIPSNETRVSPDDRRLIADLTETIVEFNQYLNQYTQMIGANAVTYYYARRYMLAAARLLEKGFLLEPMVNQFLHPAYGWAVPGDALGSA